MRGIKASLPLAVFPPCDEFINNRADNCHSDNQNSQGADSRRCALANTTCEHCGQRFIGEDREGRRVVILEGRQKRQDCRRENSRPQEGQQNVEEHLRLRGAEIEACFFLCAIKPIQARHEHQHAIGGDEARLS